MYARQLSMELRPNSREDFARTIESEILPLLRKQQGFQDGITFVNPTGKDAVAVSLWNNKESADAYNRTAFADVSKLLSTIVDGKPRVTTFEVSNSTFHKIAAAQKAA